MVRYRTHERTGQGPITCEPLNPFVRVNTLIPKKTKKHPKRLRDAFPAFNKILLGIYTSSLLAARVRDSGASKAGEHPWPFLVGSSDRVQAFMIKITPFDPPFHEIQIRASGGELIASCKNIPILAKVSMFIWATLPSSSLVLPPTPPNLPPHRGGGSGWG